MSLATLAVVVFGAALYGFWRAGELRVIQALCAGLVGFFLASSKAAPEITDAVRTVFDWISTWHI